MSKLLEQALERARVLPETRQDEIGEMILEMVDQEHSRLQLSPDQQAEVRRRIADPEHPVSEREADAFFNKFA